MHPPINIYSGTPGLGAALTNPTVLAKVKGTLTNSYPITLEGKVWPDVETAYLALAKDSEDAQKRDSLMCELIALKFRQHPRLIEEVQQRGGAPWLRTCTHFTGARSERFRKWEGAGMDSRFIRNLVKGYEMALNDVEPTLAGQAMLF